MEVESERMMQEAHSVNRDRSDRSMEPDYFSTPHDRDEPISYACITKKEAMDRSFHLSEDMYMEHAMDLKIDPSSPVESADLSMEMGGAADLVASANSSVPSSDLNAGNLTLWRFLLDLLISGRHQEIIQWTSARGEFMLLQAEEVARLWGLRKNKNHRMTYDKLSRALRYYYQKNIIQKVHGHKFVYRFVNLPDGVLQTCRVSLRDKVPFDMSVATNGTGPHNPFRSSLNGPLALLGDPNLSPRSILGRCHERLSVDAEERPAAVKVEQRGDSPHLSSPGVEGSLSSGGGGGQPSPPSSLLPPASSAGLVSCASSASSLNSGESVGGSRPCRCHPQCRQLLPEQRSVSCQTGDPACPAPPFLPAQPSPSSPPPAASPPKPAGMRTLQKGLHSLNMQKFAQCIQLQTVPTAREMMSQLGISSSSSSSAAAAAASPAAAAAVAAASSSGPQRHHRHRHSPAAAPYGPKPAANGHHRRPAATSPWALDQHHHHQQRARSVSPAFPPLFPTSSAPPGPAVPTSSASSSSSSFVWVPVHVNMLRLGQHMSAAAAAAAAASTSPTHAALKHFAFPSGGQ